MRRRRCSTGMTGRCSCSGDCVISGVSATEYGAHGRWPPLGAAVRGGCFGGVELVRDLGEALAGGALGADPVRDFGCERRGPAGCRRLGLSSGRPSLFCKQPLQLVDGNQPCAPGHLERLDEGQHAAVEGGAADAERRGCLGARVGEPLNARCLPDDRWRGGRPRRLRRSRVSLRFLVSPSQSTV